MRTIRVLVVDDSALMRKYITQILEEDARLKVVGSARDGEEAVRLTQELKPDVITLDVNMPRMDGLTALQYIMHYQPTPVVVLSSLAQKGELATFEAFALGAVECIAKPGGTVSTSLDKIADEIRSKVKAAATANIQNAARKIKSAGDAGVQTTAPGSQGIGGSKVVVIGVSTGGPKTLLEILPHLPSNFGAAVIVVQHMPAGFTRSFAQHLNALCRLPVKEAEDGDLVEPGQILVAPGDYHLKVERRLGTDKLRARLSKEPRDALYWPSVNVTMESVLHAVGGKRTVGVLLTGMGDDGAAAMVKIRQAGGATIAEAEETAVVWGMPREAIKRGGADIVAPSYRIADEILKAVQA